MATATWIRDLLAEEGVAYVELHHSEAFTAQAIAQVEHVSGHHVAKVVVVLADGSPVELVLPASRRVLLDRVRELVGAEEVRLATEAELDEYFTDCERGAIPALRHWRNVEVLMDASMQVPGDIVFQAGTHCDAVRMRFDDWFHMVKPKVANFSELPHPWPGKSAHDGQNGEWQGALPDRELQGKRGAEWNRSDCGPATSAWNRFAPRFFSALRGLPSPS